MLATVYKRWGGVSLILLILLAGAALALPFINNPMFMDDVYFFQLGNIGRFQAGGAHFYPRWWVHETFAVVHLWLGGGLQWQRLGNLLLHLAVVSALMVLTRNLLRDLDKSVNVQLSAESSALLVGALFVLHPLATFTQGYLIQRTILCATLFSLLSLLAFWRGLSGSRLALWGSCLLFALAIYAKEHAVMLPVAAFMLLVLRCRSNPIVSGGVIPLRAALAALLVQCGLALTVVLQLKGVIGVPYEILTSEVLEGEPEIARERLYPLSVLNQAGLFFKYMGLWAFPAPNSISVDVRLAFPLSFADWQLWAGAVAFVTYLVGALALLLRGGARGLLGVSLLLPAVLFCTEFSSVRLQEPFVLYRSYLWVPPLFIGFAIGLRRLRVRVLFLLLLLCLPIFAGMSWMRLKTFSHPVFDWREAADMFEAASLQPGVFGGYRIYYNLGTELRGWGQLQLALDALSHSIDLKPSFGWAWNNRGAVHLNRHDYVAAETDYRKATQLMPEQHLSWRGLAMALEAQGKRREAEQALQKVCELAGPLACRQLKPVDLLRRE